jgi:hypothetical protein
MDVLGKRLIAAVESIPDTLIWVPHGKHGVGRSAMMKHLALSKKLDRDVAVLPLTDPVITDGEITIFIWGEGFRGRSALWLKNALKKQGVESRVKSGMVIVRVG